MSHCIAFNPTSPVPEWEQSVWACNGRHVGDCLAGSVDSLAICRASSNNSMEFPPEPNGGRGTDHFDMSYQQVCAIFAQNERKS